MADRTILETEVLECGCLLRLVLEGELKVCAMVPCHLDCENFHFAHQHATVSGKPIEMKAIEER